MQRPPVGVARADTPTDLGERASPHLERPRRLRRRQRLIAERVTFENSAGAPARVMRAVVQHRAYSASVTIRC
jgi:hypothetical protein